MAYEPAGTAAPPNLTSVLNVTLVAALAPVRQIWPKGTSPPKILRSRTLGRE